MNFYLCSLNVTIGCKSRWWARCSHLCSKFGLIELVNLIWLRHASLNGMVNLRMNIRMGYEISIFVREYGRWEEKHGRMGLRTQTGKKNM